MVTFGRSYIFQPGKFISQLFWIVDQNWQMLRANPISILLVLEGQNGDLLRISVTNNTFGFSWH
jgi:hypothetical protein